MCKRSRRGRAKTFQAIGAEALPLNAVRLEQRMRQFALLATAGRRRVDRAVAEDWKSCVARQLRDKCGRIDVLTAMVAAEANRSLEAPASSRERPAVAATAVISNGHMPHQRASASAA